MSGYLTGTLPASSFTLFVADGQEPETVSADAIAFLLKSIVWEYNPVPDPHETCG